MHPLLDCCCVLFSTLPQVYIICREALFDSPSCKPALDTLGHFYHSLAAAAVEQGDKRAGAAAVERARAVFDKAAVADPMRENYWRHRRQELNKLAGNCDA